MGTATRAFPHLTDSDSVRREAAEQYGGLNDAAAFQQAHMAARDPNVEAAALRRRDEDATAEVQDDLSIAQEKVDEMFGEGEYRVIDAAVRGDALSVIVEDSHGRTSHKVVAWTDKWRSVAQSPEQIQASAEAAKGRLGAEARAEVERMVKEATEKAVEKVASLFGSKAEEIEQIRQDAVEEALNEGDDGAAGAEGSSPSTQKHVDGEPDGTGGEPKLVEYPGTKAELLALAKKHNVDAKQADRNDVIVQKLKDANVTPDS